MKRHVVRLLRPNSFDLQRKIQTTSRTLQASAPVVGVKERLNLSNANFIQTSPHPPERIPNAELFASVFAPMAKYNDFIFQECAVTGRKYTFAQMLDCSLKWAFALKKLLPNNPNPTVAFITPNSPEFSIMFIGCTAVGATVCPLNPLYTPDEISHILNDSDASLLVIDSRIEQLADASFERMKRSLPVIVIGPSKHGRPNAIELLEDPNAPMFNPAPINPFSTALLPYSSGTTGVPKGVEMSHAALTNNLQMILKEYVGGYTYPEGNQQNAVIGILPFFHIFGLMATFLPAITYGSRTITMPKFEPSIYVDLIKNNRIQGLQMVPMLVKFMASFPMITSEDLEGLSSVFVGGAALDKATAEAFKQKAPAASLQEGYGMTELLLTHITPFGEDNYGFCGKLLSNVNAKILDVETGEMMPANTPGELYIQTPSVMNGYHKNKDATKETIDADGWLRTGDVAIYNEEGEFAIVSRIKELIKVKGMQVSPPEIEATLLKHPGIADVGVVGMPHPDLGEAPVAFIIKRNEDLTTNDVHKYMSERLSKHKQLEGGIHFVDELPKNFLGKMLRRVLKDMAIQQSEKVQ